jgi:hypothetical protein
MVPCWFNGAIMSDLGGAAYYLRCSFGLLKCMDRARLDEWLASSLEF